MIRLSDGPILDDENTLDINKFSEAAAQVDGDITIAPATAFGGWDVIVPTQPPFVAHVDDRASAEFVAAAIRVAVAVTAEED
jgi:hypothetical protein